MAAAVAVTAASDRAVGGTGDDAAKTAAPGEAAAAPPGEDAVALMEAGKFSSALSAARKAVDDQPSSASAHYVYGYVLRSVFRRREAVAELERAHQLAPEDGDVAVQLAWTLAETGELERARGIADQAAKRGAGEAAELQTWVDRARGAAGERRPAPAGSPAAFLTGVMEKLERHKVRDVLKNDVDRAMLDRWAADSGSPSATATDEFVDGVASGLEEAIAARSTGATLRRYEVADSAAERAGRTYVSVTLLIDSRVTPQQIKLFRSWVADPSLPVPIDPNLQSVLRGLDPADREISLEALAAQSIISEVTIEFELAGAAGRWKIADVVEKDSGFRLSRMVEMIFALSKRGVVDLPKPKRQSSAYQIGYTLGRLIVPIGLIVLVVSLVRRRRRRQP